MHAEHGFWFRARGGVWRLHRDGFEGEVIASGAGDPDIEEALRLIAEHLDTDIRARACTHTDARALCPDCGSRVVPPGA